MLNLIGHLKCLDQPTFYLSKRIPSHWLKTSLFLNYQKWYKSSTWTCKANQTHWMFLISTLTNWWCQCLTFINQKQKRQNQLQTKILSTTLWERLMNWIFQSLSVKIWWMYQKWDWRSIQKSKTSLKRKKSKSIKQIAIWSLLNSFNLFVKMSPNGIEIWNLC